MPSERVKSNVVDVRTIFIGVGGIGSRIVKRVAEMCREGETENVNFVCLDTNANDLRSVKASDAVKKIYYVQTSSTQTVGSYLNYDKDALENWFPKSRVMFDKTVSEGAGQVRAISRLALNATIKNGNIQPLYDAIDDLFRKDGADLKQALRVAFVSSASGGTGSGMILPLSMLVRDYITDKYPNTGAIIRTTLILPEALDSVITSNAEKESQRRNAYATVKEINAFMMKGTGVFDTEEQLKRYKDLSIDFPTAGTDDMHSVANLPCDFCFLLDGQNAEDSTLVSLSQYEKQAAQALYEQNIGPMSRKAFSMEDNVIKEFANKGNFARNRFGGIGASALVYPYERIAEYIAYGWAMNSIGGEGEAAKWTKYDKIYETKKREAEQKGLSDDDMPKIEEEYVSALMNDQEKFSKNLRSNYSLESFEDEKIDMFFDDFVNEMYKALAGNRAINDIQIKCAGTFSKNIANDLLEGKGIENVTEYPKWLSQYEGALRANAEKAAKAAAEGIFNCEAKTSRTNEPFTLEGLLKTSKNKILHPNAMRFVLYLVKQGMEERIETADSDISTARKTIESFKRDDADKFDVKKTKKTESSLKDLCESAADEKNKKNNELFDALGKHLKRYYDAIKKFGEKTAERAGFQVGLKYVQEIEKCMNEFFSSFGSKVKDLEKRRADIVDELKFRKGDSTLYVCSDKAVLDELERVTSRYSEDSTMLDSELCGKIFDALKSNVAFNRETEFMDVIENDGRIDIFDDILLGYFKKDVLKRADSLDLNIVQATALENSMMARSRGRLAQSDDDGRSGDKKLVVTVSHDDNVNHIKHVVEKVQRLAAPGIQRMTFSEPREIHLVAFNESLKYMREYRIDEFMPNKSDGAEVDTVSKYEMRFFNALYNLTPDKISKFAYPASTETGKKNAGLYHKAYVEYAKNLGPDSTKNLLLTTHIDKRWDNIIRLPELDFDYNSLKIRSIQQAMIYALLCGNLNYRYPSMIEGSKQVYVYEDSNENIVELVVSNATPCDQFFEVLDAFYMNPALVEDVEKIRNRRNTRDANRNANYDDTMFKRDLDEFTLEISHEGPAGLLEIPVFYRESLPNSLRDQAEFVNLIDSVIDVFRQEIFYWEKPDDAVVIFRNVLVEQFELFITNYKKYYGKGGFAQRKPKDDLLVDVMYRKIRSIVSDEPEAGNLDELLAKLKELVSTN